MREKTHFLVLSLKIDSNNRTTNHYRLLRQQADRSVIRGYPLLPDRVLGFSLSERLISLSDSVYDIAIRESEQGIIVDLTVSQRDFQAIKAYRRHLRGNSGCGLCGVEHLHSVVSDLPRLSNSVLPDAYHLMGIRETIKKFQKKSSDSGALHAALLMDQTGQIAYGREDIGRHNALDKVLGAGAKAGLNLTTYTVIMTSRCSIELVRKCLVMGVSSLATFASPSTLSVKLAGSHGLNLIHIARNGDLRLYRPQGILYE